MKKIYRHLKYAVCHYAAYQCRSELQSIRTDQTGILLFQKHWLREIRKSSLAACFMETMNQLSNSTSTPRRAIIWMYTLDNYSCKTCKTFHGLDTADIRIGWWITFCLLQSLQFDCYRIAVVCGHNPDCCFCPSRCFQKEGFGRVCFYFQWNISQMRKIRMMYGKHLHSIESISCDKTVLSFHKWKHSNSIHSDSRCLQLSCWKDSTQRFSL